jgi:hypothetical protein
MNLAPIMRCRPDCHNGIDHAIREETVTPQASGQDKGCEKYAADSEPWLLFGSGRQIFGLG